MFASAYGNLWSVPEVFLDWCEGVEAGAQGHQLKTMQIAILVCSTNLQMRPSPKRQGFHDVLHAAPEPYSEIPKSHKKEEEEEAFGHDSDNKDYDLHKNKIILNYNKYLVKNN